MRTIFIVVSCFFFLKGQSQASAECNKLATDLLEQKEYYGAIDCFSKIIELNPKDSFAYFDRAMAKEIVGDDKGAIADYTNAIGLDAMNVDAYCLRGMGKDR